MIVEYDVVVVGGRCAGAPLAAALARAGHRVLVLDRETGPVDTVSTHWVLRPGVELLERWGLLPALEATGCPPIRHIRLDADGDVLAGFPARGDTPCVTYAPRRTVLDALLLDAAREAGAEVREGVAVRGVRWRGDRVTGVHARDARGREIEVGAVWVVGADGRGSGVAHAVGAPFTVDRGALAATVYGYWSGLEVPGAEIRTRPGAGVSMWPTHGGLTTVAATLSRAAYRTAGGAAAAYARTLDRVPDVRERLADGHLVEWVRGAPSLRNFFRRAHGPGWALAGDAGHHQDPIGARGISDAFTDAQRLAVALDAALTGAMPAERALARFEARRDTGAAAVFGFVCRQAALAEPDEEFRRAVRAAARDPRETAELLAVFAGGRRIEDYFSPARAAVGA